MLYYKDINNNYYALKHERKDLIAITEAEFNAHMAELDQINQPNPVYAQISEFKSKLAETDYKVMKYIEGKLSVAEFEQIKVERQAWRDEINRLEQSL